MPGADSLNRVVRVRAFVAQLVRFFLSTLVALGLDFGLYAVLCSLGVIPGWASLISSGTATIVLYFFSTRLTFRTKHSLGRALAFCVWYTFSIAGFALLVQGIHEQFDLHWFLSKAATLPFSFSINFLVSRAILYRRGSEISNDSSRNIDASEPSESVA